MLAHDSFRRFNKRSFSFVDTLTKDFIKNHWFSTPVGVYDGSTLLYKIDFTAKRKIAEDNFQGNQYYIQPDDYSIHKLEYYGSYSDSEKKKKDIFSIETEYGHEPAQLIPECVLNIYLSIIHLLIPDSTDNDIL